MSRVYSTRFFSDPHFVATPASYVVPAGFVAVLRDVWIYLGNNATPAAWQMESGTGAVLWAAEALPFNPQFWFWQGRQVYNAGDTIQVVNTGVAPLDATASGYLLSLP
jgi:hypothetical protein